MTVQHNLSVFMTPYRRAAALGAVVAVSFLFDVCGCLDAGNSNLFVWTPLEEKFGNNYFEDSKVVGERKDAYLHEALIEAKRAFLLTARGVCFREKRCSEGNVDRFVEELDNFTINMLLCLDWKIINRPHCSQGRSAPFNSEVVSSALRTTSTVTTSTRLPMPNKTMRGFRQYHHCHVAVDVLVRAFGVPAIRSYHGFGSTVVYPHNEILSRFVKLGVTFPKDIDVYDVAASSRDMSNQVPGTVSFKEFFASQYVDEFDRHIYPLARKRNVMYDSSVFMNAILKTFGSKIGSNPENVLILAPAIDLDSPLSSAAFADMLYETCKPNSEKITKFYVRVHKSCNRVVDVIQERSLAEVKRLGKDAGMSDEEISDIWDDAHDATADDRLMDITKSVKTAISPSCPDPKDVAVSKMTLIADAASQLTCDGALLRSQVRKTIRSMHNYNGCMLMLGRNGMFHTEMGVSSAGMTQALAEKQEREVEYLPKSLRAHALNLLFEFDKQCFIRPGICENRMRSAFSRDLRRYTELWARCLKLNIDLGDDDEEISITPEEACEDFILEVSRVVPHITEPRFIPSEGVYRTITTFWSGKKAEASSTRVGDTFDGVVSMQYAVFANGLLAGLYTYPEYQAYFPWQLWEFCSKMYARQFLAPKDDADKHIVIAYMDALRVGSVFDTTELGTIVKQYIRFRKQNRPKDWLKMYVKVYDNCQRNYDKDKILYYKWMQKLVTLCGTDGANSCLRAEREKPLGIKLTDECNCPAVKNKDELLCGTVVSGNDFICHNFLIDNLYCDVDRYLDMKMESLVGECKTEQEKEYVNEFFQENVTASRFLYIDNLTCPL